MGLCYIYGTHTNVLSTFVDVVVVYFFSHCIMQEFLVKNADRIELMSFLGLFGAIISAIQMYPFNFSDKVDWHEELHLAMEFFDYF